MKKYYLLLSLFFLSIYSVGSAQTYNDGCMTIDYKVTDTWVQEFEDPFFSDESIFRWYGSDNANLDGQGWRGGSCLALTGLNFIGWRTIFDGGSDQVGTHPVYNLFTQTYGIPNTNTVSAVPEFLGLRGRYHGDDCPTGSTCSYDNNSFTCLFDPDDYGWDDVLDNNINYRVGPPNMNFTLDRFTTNHGNSDFGAEVRINYTSPRPTVATANPSTICGDGTGSTLAASGAIHGGEYVWMDATGSTIIGIGQTVMVLPTTTTSYRVYTRNAGILSQCYNETVVSVINCAPNCLTKTFNDGNTYSVDCSVLTLPFVNFTTPADFPAGSLIEDVNVGITWTKTDGTCAGPLSGDPFHTESAFTLLGTGACASTSLVETGNYSGSTDIGTITTLFDMDAASMVSGTPVSGNYLPSGNLDDCIGGTPFGSWSIQVGDDFCQDPICVTEYTVQLCVCELATDATSALASPSTVCLNNSGTVSLSYAGGSGDELHWFEGSCGSSSPIAISINGVAVDVPSPSATTTYYARWYSGPTCGYSPGCVTTTVTVDPLTVPGTLSGGISPICEGGLSGTLNLAGNTGSVVGWERSSDGGATYVSLAGTAGATSYTSPALAVGTYQFVAIVQNGVCDELPTAPLTIQVNPNSNYSAVGAQSNTVCSGDSTIVAVADALGLIQWQVSTDNMNFTNVVGGNLSAITTGELINTTTSDITYYYQAIIDNNPCIPITTAPAIEVVVQPETDAGIVSADQEVCTGEVPGDIVASGFLGSFLNWERDTVASFTNPVAFGTGSSTILGTAIGPLTQTTYFRAVIQNGVCPSDNSPTLTISVLELPTNTISANQTICDGDIPMTLLGSLPTLGNGTYTYQWQSHPTGSVVFTDVPSATMQNYSPPALTQTTVYRRVVDSGPCQTISNEITVTVSSYPGITSVMSTDIECNGAADGVINITSPDVVTYSIDSGMSFQPSNSFSGLSGGDFYIAVMNSTGCVSYFAGNPETIDEPDSISINLSGVDPSCGTTNDGSVSVIASGGTPGFEYALNGGSYQSGTMFGSLGAGTYTVTVRDMNGCTNSETIDIQNQYNSNLVIDTVINVGCPGSADGSIQVSASGGVLPYTFSIDNATFQSDSAFNNLVAGNYTVWALDFNGCSSVINAIVTENPSIQIDVDSVMNVSCNGDSDGAIYISASGSTGNFSYEWRQNGVVISTMQDITAVAAGAYNVTVTGSPSCQSTTVITIAEPTVIDASINNVTNVACAGEANGSVDVDVSGGTPPYTYSWSDGAGVVSTSPDLSAALAGTYTVTITDDNNCSVMLTAMITEPIILSTGTTNVDPSCGNSGNGSITVNANGGTPGYSYTLNGGPSQSNVLFDNLNGGNYVVVTTDQNGCQTTNNVTLTSIYSFSLVVDSTSNVTCTGQNDGSITLEATGGVAPIIYTMNGATVQVNDPLFTGLASGSYTFVAEDANGCTATTSAVINENPVITMIIDSTSDVSCGNAADGAIYVSVAGGDGTYTYSWNDPNSSMTEDLTGISSGTYSLTVTDGSGCSAQISATISEPTSIDANINSVTNVSCNGALDGAIDLNVTGGTPPYTYSWVDGLGVVASTQDINNVGADSYTVTITDANNCFEVLIATITEPVALTTTTTDVNPSCDNSQNGSITVNASDGTPNYTYSINGGAAQTNNTFSALSAGTYTVVTSDANGCESTNNVTLTNTYSLSLSAGTVTNVSCSGQNDGAVTLIQTGGVAPITYTINSSNPQVNNPAFVGLAPGFYSFEAVDANGCSASTTAVISENAPISIAVDSTSDVSCGNISDGAIYVSVSGGNGVYTYSWNDPSSSMTEDLTGVAAGTYTLIVTDGAGCTDQISATISAPSTLSAILVGTTNISCNGAADGALDVSVAGGVPPYAFSWISGGAGVGANEDLINLVPGSYMLTVTDDKGCIVTVSASITEPALLAGSITVGQITCFGDDDATASAMISGGTAPYEYLWSNFETTSTINGLGSGSISVQVKDANDCILTLTETIVGPTEALGIDLLSITDVTCPGGSDGSISTVVSGGTVPYSITWSPGASNMGTLSNLIAGDYIISVTDGNGCTESATYTVTDPEDFATSLSITQPSCFGAETGQAFVGVSGGTAPYTYSWNTSPPQTGALANNLAGDTSYDVVVTDVNGCQTTTTAVMVYPSEILVSTNGSSVNCTNNANGTVSVSAAGGNPPYMYQLNGVFQNDTLFEGLSAGNYTVFVTDNSNCTATGTFTITQTPALEIELQGSGNDLIPYTSELFIVRGEEVNLEAVTTFSNGATILSYNWSPAGASGEINVVDTANCPLCPTTSITPVDNIIVTLEVLDDNNCAILDTLLINVSQESIAFVPSAFSPNEDGWNDYFEMNILGATDFDVRIFNRWGEEIFVKENQVNGPNVPEYDITNPRGAWDGTYKGEPVMEGAYAYQVEVTYFDGEKESMSGTVTVIR